MHSRNANAFGYGCDGDRRLANLFGDAGDLLSGILVGHVRSGGRGKRESDSLLRPFL